MLKLNVHIQWSKQSVLRIGRIGEKRSPFLTVYIRDRLIEFASRENGMPSDTETRPMFDDEAQLVEQLKAGHEQAWEKCLEIYAADLRWDIITSLKKRNLPPEAADDIAQETWLTAVRQIGHFTYSAPGKFYHWLRVISLNHVRTLSRQGEWVSLDALEREMNDADQALDKFLYAIRSTDNTIEDTLELREQLSKLDHVLQRLSPRARELILRRLLLGETPIQLARAYPSMTARSISQALLRAKKLIQVYLKSDEPPS